MSHIYRSFCFFLILFVVGINNSHSQELNHNDFSLEGWKSDINYLQEELPKRHVDLYHNTSRARFDSAFSALKNKVTQLNNVQRLIEVSKLMALIGPGNGHSRIRSANGILTRQLPLRFYEFNEGLYVINTSPEYKYLLGAKVLEIEQTPVNEIIANINEFVPADNEWNRKLRAPLFLSLPEILSGLGVAISPKQTIEISFENNGEKSEVALNTIPLEKNFDWIDSWEDYPYRFSNNSDWISALDEIDNKPLYLQKLDNSYWYQHLTKENSLYVQINSVRNKENQTLEDFFKEIFTYYENYSINKLILDLRHNAGGNLLLTTPFIHGIIANQKINTEGSFFVITGRNTFSAAQYLTTKLERETNAIFIGEPSGGKPNHFGDAPRFELPNTGIRLSASILYYQNSWPWNNDLATYPRLYFPPKWGEFRNGEDPSLEAALNFDPISLFQQLKEIYQKENIEGTQEFITSFKAKERYKYYPADQFVFEFGNYLERQSKFSDAAKIFEYLRTIYKRNINLLENLARVYTKAGKQDRAFDIYENILEIDSTHQKAQKAVNKNQ